MQLYVGMYGGLLCVCLIVNPGTFVGNIQGRIYSYSLIVTSLIAFTVNGKLQPVVYTDFTIDLLMAKLAIKLRKTSGWL